MGCVARSLIVLVLTFALFWIPVPGLGGFIAGGVGGYLSGSPGRAVRNALVPFVAIGLLILALGLHFGSGEIGSVLGGIALVLLVINNLTLLTGAFVGGLVRSHRSRAASRT